MAITFDKINTSMGNSGSTLVDCVQDGDTQRLKEQLSERLADLHDGEITTEELQNEVEDAIHAALSVEITTPQQYQQLQIAIELMLHVAPTALKTTECNSVRWTAVHRACVTGNLSFISFLFLRHAKHMEMHRDAFGLLPVDLIPPEIGGIDLEVPGTLDTKSLPSTSHERIARALHLLREGKREIERLALQLLVNPPGSSSPNQDEESQTVPPDYSVTFEPKRDQLPRDLQGSVHQLTSPLRIRYYLPRIDSTLHGYFQLIWRADTEPRSEEPHYENHILLRDSLDVDHPATRSQDLTSNQRRLHDDDDSGDHAGGCLTGSVPIDVSHLQHDAVCHVLFVASDKFLMKREIVLSTEGVRLAQPDPLDGDYHGEYEDEMPYEYGAESDGESDGFVFHVGGEAFTHPSEKLAGLTFETVAEFEDFVRELRVPTPTTPAPIMAIDTTTKGDSPRRPVLPSNQDDESPRVQSKQNDQEPHDNQHEDADEDLDELWEMAA